MLLAWWCNGWSVLAELYFEIHVLDKRHVSDNAGAIVSGSHTDAIPLAGMYDGTLGVIGAIAALKALKQSGFTPRRSIDALMFTSEEPTRFGLGCIGRQVSQCGASPDILATNLARRNDLHWWQSCCEQTNQGIATGSAFSPKLASYGRISSTSIAQLYNGYWVGEVTCLWLTWFALHEVVQWLALWLLSCWTPRWMWMGQHSRRPPVPQDTMANHIG